MCLDQGRPVQLKRSVELRLKLVEALVKVTQDCGKMLPKYSQLLISTLLSGVHDPEALVRASSLSNLADVCRLLRFSIGPIIQEVHWQVFNDDIIYSFFCLCLSGLKHFLKLSKEEMLSSLRIRKKSISKNVYNDNQNQNQWLLPWPTEVFHISVYTEANAVLFVGVQLFAQRFTDGQVRLCP